MQPQFDERDAQILKQRIAMWAEIQGPRVGDFVKMKDGTLRRFTHDWGDDIQTTVGPVHPCSGDASFYFGGDYMSFSGSLDHAIPKSSLREIGEQEGGAWFFHHNEMRAHNGVSVRVPFRVYEQTGAV